MLVIQRGAKASGGVRLHTLFRGQLPQRTEGLRDGMALFGRQRAELRHGTTNLGALRRVKPFDGLRTSQHLLALPGVHGVKLCQTVEHTLLRGSWQLLKAGFVLQGLLLLLRSELTVLIHPLSEVLATRASMPHLTGRTIRGRCTAFNRRRLLHPLRLCRDGQKYGRKEVHVPCPPFEGEVVG